MLTNAEIRNAAQFRPGSVELAADIQRRGPETMRPICAIDASLTGTAVAVGTDAVEGIRVNLFSSSACGSEVSRRFRRYEDLATRVADHVEASQPGAILLEGYSYGSQHAHQGIYEFGAMLRRKLLFIGATLIEVPPARLKQFVTGKGNAKKDVMAGFTAKRWDRCFHSSDECDAFGLCVLGLCALGRYPGTQQDRKFAADVAALLGVESAEEPMPLFG